MHFACVQTTASPEWATLFSPSVHPHFIYMEDRYRECAAVVLGRRFHVKGGDMTTVVQPNLVQELEQPSPADTDILEQDADGVDQEGDKQELPERAGDVEVQR